MSDPLDFGVDLSTVRDRLNGLSYFLSVTDILEASEALDETLPASPPAAFVGVSSERALPNKLIQGHAQHVDVQVEVLFVELAARFDRNARDRMERTRKAIIRILLGFRPRNAERNLGYVDYRVVSIGNGLAWGSVTFSTSYRLSITG